MDLHVFLAELLSFIDGNCFSSGMQIHSAVSATALLCRFAGNLQLDAARSRKQVPPCCGWDRQKWGGESHGRFMFLDYAEYCGTSPMKTDPALAEIENGLSYSGREDFLVHLGGYGCSCQRFVWIRRSVFMGPRQLPPTGMGRAPLLLPPRHEKAFDNFAGSKRADELHTLGILGCGPKRVSHASDFCQLRHAGGKRVGVDNRGGNWTRLVRHFDPDIILISSGPHINRPMPFRNADFASVIKQVAHEHQINFPDKILIWKTQAPGGCTSNISDSIPGPAFFSSLPYPH